MEKKTLGCYQIKDKVAETQASVIMRAKKMTQENEIDELFYVLKQNKLSDVFSLEKEVKIIQEIEEVCPKSIVITTTMWKDASDNKEYAVMQYRKNGMFLSDIIRYYELEKKERVPLELQLEIIESILQSLSVLHDFRSDSDHQGYLHLDIHPGNIFLENADPEKLTAGTAKFIDFSNAVPLRHNKKGEQPGAFICATPGYSAPEKYRIHSRTAGAGTDLYSVAAIFARMMMRGKFSQNAVEQLIIANDKQTIETDVFLNRIFCGFLKKGLEKNLSYRFQSADEMRKSFEGIKSDYYNYRHCQYYNLLQSAFQNNIPIEIFLDSGIEWNESQFVKAVIRLDSDMHKSVIDAKMQEYIYRGLEGLLEKHRSKRLPVQVLRNLFFSGIACYNHVGKSVSAIRCFEKMRDTGTISLMEYLDAVPRIAEAYKDYYQYETAKTLLVNNIAALERIRDCSKDIISDIEHFKECSPRQIVLARSYSALGTLLTLLHEEGVEKFYRRAMDEFDSCDIENRKITMAHILHSAIELSDKKLFEEYAAQYFTDELKKERSEQLCGEKEKLLQWYEYAVNISRNGMFPLFVFIKGLHAFYKERIDSDWIVRLIGLAEDGVLGKRGVYPLNLIYKHIGLILYENGEVEKAQDIIGRAIALVCPEGVRIDRQLDIMVLITYGIGASATVFAGTEENSRYIFDQLFEHSKQEGWEALHGQMLKMQAAGCTDVARLLRGEYS